MKLLAAVALAMVAPPAFAQGGGVAQSSAGLPFKGLHHATMTVSDIDRTVAFYAQAIPFKVVRRATIDGSAFPAALLAHQHARVDVALVATPTGYLELLDFEPGTAAPANPRPLVGPGYTHVCFQSPATDPAIKRFMAAGLQIISRFGKPDGVDIGGYGVRYAYGRDPDGLMIENESLDRPRRGEAAWLTHIANVVHDRDAMLAFYTKLLGHAPHRTIEQENKPRLDDVANIDNLSIRGGWINAGNMEVEVWQYVRPATPAPLGDRKLDEIGYSAFALEVADVKAEAARLRKAGIRLTGKPVTVAGWRVQYGYDPEGNLFAVQQRTTAPASESVDALPPALAPVPAPAAASAPAKQ